MSAASAILAIVLLTAAPVTVEVNPTAVQGTNSPVISNSTIAPLRSQIWNLDAIAIPQMLSYQGKLTDTLGVPVSDTLYAVRFRLYAQPSGGTHLWEEDQQVGTQGGLFSVLLGAVTPIGSVPDAGALYLGMAVEGGAELTPRLRIASAAYAYLAARAANADLLQGKDTSALDARYVNEAQANSVTSAMIANATIAAADLGQMGASSGQVMKWTGSAWTPRNDSVGSGGTGTVRKVVQATGVVCAPNPITDSGTVRFDSTYGDGRYIRNQSTTGQNASFRIIGTGQASQLRGVSAAADQYAVYADGGTHAGGIYARCSTASYAAVSGAGLTTSHGVAGYTGSASRSGVAASNSNSSGTGLIAMGNGGPGYYLTAGSGGAFTGTGYGSYHKATSSSGTAIVGLGNNVGNMQTYADGSGGAFTGTVCGGYGEATSTSGYTYGLYGEVANSTGGFGVYGHNSNTGGTGVAGAGNNLTAEELTAGSGGAFTGSTYGTYGHATSTGTGAGGYFSNGYGSYAYVAYYNGSTNYKIAGGGTVSTIMPTREGRKTLFAPEMPEAYFEDAGEGQLENGHCRIDLERLFSDCITVDAPHPLKVFVQLEDDCNGVYVRKDQTGFDVWELQGGKSHARFSWRALAKWKGNENVRLPEGPGPLPTVKGEGPRAAGSQIEAVAVPAPREATQAAPVGQ